MQLSTTAVTKRRRALTINTTTIIFLIVFFSSRLTLSSNAHGFRDQVQLLGVTGWSNPHEAEPINSQAHSRVSRLSKRTRTKPIAYLPSPLSNRLLEVGEVPLSGMYEFEFEDVQGAQGGGGGNKEQQHWNSDCRTIRSSVELIRHEHQHDNQDMARTCRGLVQVNRCEGSCQSSVQPSVKSSSGLRKECSCCNEGSFKRIQVRLNECRNAQTGVLIEDDSRASFMDVILDEPSDCKCRPCDTII